MNIIKKLNRNLGLAAVLATSVALVALAGCSHGYSYYRPPVSAFDKHDTGLQSRDIVDMTDKMAPQLLKIPEIAHNPYKVIIVLGHLRNNTSTPWQNDQIYLARMRAQLMQYANNRVAFVLSMRKAAAMQKHYLGRPGERFHPQTGTWQATTQVPEYVLNGTFYDAPNTATTYYLCTMKLTDLTSGMLVWEGHYEVRTRNP